jgi:hypothetical protein
VMLTDAQVRMGNLVLSRGQRGCQYFVLWIDPNGLRKWSGPYLTEDEADTATAVRDGNQLSFVVKGDL